MPVSRRKFLEIGALGGAGVLLASRFGGRLLMDARAELAAATGVPLAGSSIPQFVDPLPLLDVSGGPMETVVGATQQTLTLREFRAKVMPSTFVPAAGTYGGTWVWGYRKGTAPPAEPAGTYIGPVVVASRGTPIEMTYVNALGDTSTSELLAWVTSTDQTLHWADPLNGSANACAESVEPAQPPSGSCALHYAGPIPAVTHLHGGEVPPVLDGGPDSWITSDGAYKGPAYYTRPGVTAPANATVYRYPNVQEAAPIWFHDHVLGLTRLNVYAGLAGAYLVTDPGLALPTGLHPVGLQQGADGPVEFTIPLVLQDRMFDTAGQLFFPNVGINPEHPFWIPEFVGDTIVVNGKVWPFLNVQAKRYRFLILNGSNARTYELFFVNPVTKAMGPALWQIATDGGYLDVPVKIDPNAPKGQLQRLVILPGERAELIVDFGAFAGQTLLLRNIAKTPYPGGTAPNGSTTGRIIQIRVGAAPASDASYNPASGISLRPPMVRLVTPTRGTLAPGVTAAKTRQLTLNEVQGPGGPLEILVNNTELNGLRADGTVRSDFTAVTVGGITEYFSELPAEGDTEVWEIVNLTADAHPIHLHLAQFQLMNRQAFDVPKYSGAYGLAFPGGVYSPGYGPPLDYATGNPRALGGNPDVVPFLKGPVMLPALNEAGWKDTVMMLPGQVTRIAVRWAPPDKGIDDPSLIYAFDPNQGGHGFVWHCHIIDHEDNEMMRPSRVTPKSGATRTYVQGTDY